MSRILIVDDSLIMRTIIKDTLKEAGFRVFIDAESGEAAIQLYEQFYPELVLMDIIMSGISGMDAAKKILTKHPSAKIIIISVVEDEDTKKLAMEIGVKEFISKPFDLEYLKDLVKKVLSFNKNQV